MKEEQTIEETQAQVDEIERKHMEEAQAQTVQLAQTLAAQQAAQEEEEWGFWNYVGAATGVVAVAAAGYCLYDLISGE